MKATQRLSKDKRGKLKRRHLKIRKRVNGTSERPRLMVRKSLKHLYAVVFDDSAANGTQTIASFSSKPKGADPKKSTINVDNATALGKSVGEALKAKGIETVVFDRGGYRYHGRVKAFCEAVREAGIKI